ncbi:MAG: aspartyl protease family protein [Pseudomonadota bacterium]
MAHNVAIKPHVRNALLACVVVMAAMGAAQATERETLMLMANDREWPITTIQINGQVTPALLDTGATIALIDDDLLAYQPSETDAFETRVLGIGGQRLFPVTHVSSLSAGARSWYGLRVAVNTKDEFPVQQNVLPTSLFGASIIDFDFPNDRVELYDGYPKFVHGSHRSAISYIQHEGLIFIPIRINGVRGKALLDTGASVSFVNTRFADQARGVPRVEEEQDIQGSDLERNRVRIYNFRKLRFGDNQLARFSLPVFETDLFATLGFEDEPMMVMGMDILKHFRVQLDQKRQRVVMLRDE